MANRFACLLAVFVVPCLVFGVFAGTAFAGIGFKDLENSVVEQGGSPAVRAGSHPLSMTTNFDFTDEGEALKDTRVDLPAGLVGDPGAVPKCSFQQFTTEGAVRHDFSVESCPDDSQVGVVEVKTNPDVVGEHENFNVGLFNLVPPPGVPAELGFNILKIPVVFSASLRAGGDNGISLSIHNASEVLQVFGVRVTVWGVPGDAAHDALRGACLGAVGESFGSCPSTAPPTPFLSLPTSCPLAPPVLGVSVDSWADPDQVAHDETPVIVDGSGNPLGLMGCDALDFRPSITLAPETVQADTTTGLTAEVKLPQDSAKASGGLATGTLQKATVVLPAGMSINPGQAAGLQVCTPAQAGLGTDGPSACPAASQLGTAEVKTPLVPDTLKGGVYLLQSSPPDVKLLLTSATDGVFLKVQGEARLDPVTGQVTTVFQNIPQQPFSDLRLSLNGGAQAAFIAPAACGVHASSADFTPWGAPQEADVLTGDSFAITGAPAGGGCSGPLPFAPSLVAGATNDQAGAFTGLSLLLQRGDGQQRVGGLQFRLPEGLLARVGSLPPCPEPQASTGACPAASQIGHVVVTAGAGSFPLVVPEPGQPQAPVYLTGGYKGAPYGLSIAVPVIAGPFNLGTTVVRGAISVDPHTAAVTVTTDPIPQILDGVPTDIRTVNAVIDKAGFMFNPTNCTPMSFGATASGSEGASAVLSSRFQVGACRSLEFHPSFKVSTQAKTSKKSGASLDVKVIPPAGQANIGKTVVVLPKQLPARLTTIQQACPEAVFAANPASCPAGSNIGTGTATTPILSMPLSGPAYLVSHGGAAFPDVVVILQGGGVTVDLTGAVNIKGAVTTASFNSIPDAPISTFELKLPEGPHSGLAAVVPAKAKGSLCGLSLVMPTTITGQNGAVVKQNTKIAVTGCPGAKKKPTQRAHGRKHQAKQHGARKGSVRRG